MADDQRTQQLRGLLEAYLQRMGIDTSKPFSCLNKPAHPDKHPSMTYWKEGQKVVCHSACKVKWSIFELIGYEYNLPDQFAKRKAKTDEVLTSMGLIGAQDANATGQTAAAKTGADPMGTNTSYFPLGIQNMEKREADETEPPPPDFTKDYMLWHEARHKTDYWKRRGFTDALLDMHSLRLGYDEKHKAVIIPCTSDYFVSRIIDAEMKGQDRFSNFKRPHVRLFNETALDGTDPVFIVEGWADALSIIQAGYPAISLNGASHFPKLTAAWEARNWKIPPMILLLDRDQAGLDTTDKLKLQLQRANVPHFHAILPEQYEDANLMLQSDPGHFLRVLGDFVEMVRQAAQDLQNSELDQTSFHGHLQRYLNRKVKLVCFPTGFSELDEVLNGGLTPGVTILGAQSSVGKTTLALQIANNVAKSGGLVLIFSLEQSIDELLEKSVSMCSKGTLTQYEVRTIAATNDQEDNRWDKFVAAGCTLEGYAQNLHVIETARSVDHIATEIQRICALTGKTPLVIIDYLQQMRPTKEWQTDKQAVDYNMNELKRISKEYGLPILAISSVSRGHYNQDMNEAAFKESGGIEFSSDTSLGLQFRVLEQYKTAKAAENAGFDPDAEKAREIREVQVKVIKQRSGVSGKRANFNYDAAHNRFDEVPSNSGYSKFTPTRGGSK